MKQFLLFAGYNYYPTGGWYDFQGSYATLEEAREAAASWPRAKDNWWHIIDNQTGENVAEN
jgi:hypothetical protein